MYKRHISIVYYDNAAVDIAAMVVWGQRKGLRAHIHILCTYIFTYFVVCVDMCRHRCLDHTSNTCWREVRQRTTDGQKNSRPSQSSSWPRANIIKYILQLTSSFGQQTEYHAHALLVRKHMRSARVCVYWICMNLGSRQVHYYYYLLCPHIDCVRTTVAHQVASTNSTFPT